MSTSVSAGILKREVGAESKVGMRQRIISLITADSVIPLDDALLALPYLERIIFGLVDREDTVELPSLKPDGAQERIFCVSKIGARIGIVPQASLHDDSHEVLLVFRLGLSGYAMYQHERENYYKKIVSAFRMIRQRVLDLEANNLLVPVLAQIQSAIEHLAPVIVFVGKITYSSESYWGKNLGGRNRKDLLKELYSVPAALWRYEDVCFIYAMSILLKSGGVYRLEEVNWTQVDPISLEQYFYRKINGYRLFFPDRRNPFGGHPSIETLAEEIKSLENDLIDRFEVARKINGLTLNKRLLVIGSRDAGAVDHGEIRSRMACLYGCDPDDPEFSGYTALLWKQGRIPEYLEKIVFQLMEVTKSDFAMTRCNRRFLIYKPIQAYSQDDFFCLVLSGNRADIAEAKYSIGEIRWRQSKRMLFNGWKFWHGNYEPDIREKDQYWFVPPKAGDIAYYEDRLHSGHANALVGQAIRVPGDITFYNGVERGMKLIQGAMDVRVARVDMQLPFNINDYKVVSLYKRLLCRIYQSLADLAQVSPNVEIVTFDREYHYNETIRY